MDLAANGGGRRQERVPLDALIELRTGDGHDRLEADGLDVSLGGLSARAAFVPAIGTRLSCAFRCPPSQETVQADAEVTWSEWCGPGAGAFGVRFLELDTRGAKAIRALVEPPLRPPSVELELPPATRLFIDGLSASVDTELKLVDDCRVVLEQELSFLKLGRGVEVELPGKGGQRGRIASIELRLGARDVPTLVFGVLLDEAREEAVVNKVVAAPTLVAEAAPSAPDGVVPESDGEAAVGPSDTWPERVAYASSEAAEAEADAADEQAAEEADDDERDEEYEQEEQAPLALAARGRLKEGPAKGSSHAPSDEERFAAALRPEPLALKKASEIWAVLLVALRTRILPTLRTSVLTARQLLARNAPALLSWLRAASARVLGGARMLRGRLAAWNEQRAQLRAQKVIAAPRVQRAPARVERAPVERVQKAPAPARAGRPRNQRLWALALAALGVALGIYALAPRSEAKRAPELLNARVMASELPSANPEPVEAAPQEALLPAAPKTPAVAAAGAAPLPEGLGAGPLDSQLGGAASAPQPTVEPLQPVQPQASPSAEPRAGGDPVAFGAEHVREGRSYLLRMSGPVSSIEGEAREGGFTVRIPGRLALDRASPIATTHRAVARAMILNRGDYAELTVDFLPGMSPKYRVAAKDNAIEVTLERP